MTLQETLTAKLQALEAEYMAAKSKLEADIAALNSSGWLAQDIEAVKSWFAAISKHL
jgi:hypothetical protein